MHFCLKQKSKHSFIHALEAHLRRPKKSHILFFIVWWGSEAHLSKVCLRATLGNEMHMLKVFGHEQVCFWRPYNAHCAFPTCSWNLKSTYLTEIQKTLSLDPCQARMQVDKTQMRSNIKFTLIIEMHKSLSSDTCRAKTQIRQVTSAKRPIGVNRDWW